MTKSEQMAIRNYFLNVLKYKSIADFKEHSVNSLIFSYLMGMDPIECTNMYLESHMNKDEVNEYYDIENYIYQLIKEFE